MTPSALMSYGAAAMVVTLVAFFLGIGCWLAEPGDYTRRSEEAYQGFRNQCEDDGYTRTDCDMMWAKLQGRGCP